MPTSKKPERLVVDANPILSALLGRKARRIFFETDISEFAVPEAVLEEVRKYIPAVARKLGTRADFLEYALELLPLSPYPRRTYARRLREARLRIAHRDPDDVDTLALCLYLGFPLWSNDRDFEDAKVVVVTSANLLATFFGKGRG